MYVSCDHACGRICHKLLPFRKDKPGQHGRVWYFNKKRRWCNWIQYTAWFERSEQSGVREMWAQTNDDSANNNMKLNQLLNILCHKIIARKQQRDTHTHILCRFDGTLSLSLSLPLSTHARQVALGKCKVPLRASVSRFQGFEGRGPEWFTVGIHGLWHSYPCPCPRRFVERFRRRNEYSRKLVNSIGRGMGINITAQYGQSPY